MIKLEFQTLKIQGFAGIQDYTVVKLNDPGLTVITGPNGSTKTTRFSALAWCLYGKPLKPGSSIETWEHVRKEGYQGTMVSVSFYRAGAKYKITRCKDYSGLVGEVKGANRLVVEKNGTIAWPLLKDKRDIQAAITELPGFSLDLFINSIIFPQKVTRFIENKGPERKRLFEEAFRMLWLNKALDIAKAREREAFTRLSVAEKELKTSQDSIDGLKSMLDTVKQDKLNFEAEKAQSLTNIQKTIQELEAKSALTQAKVDPIFSMERSLKAAKEEILRNPIYIDQKTISLNLNKVMGEKGQTQALIRSLEGQLKRLGAKGSYVCPTCNQPVNSKTHKSHLTAAQDSLAENQKTLENLKPRVEALLLQDKQASDLGAELKGIEGKLRDLTKELTEATQHNLEIAGAKGRVEELQNQWETLNKSEYRDTSAPIRAKFLSQKQSHKQFTKRVKRAKREYDLVNWVISNPLSPNGIKAYMFNRLIGLVNQQLIRLEKFTGFGVELVVEGSGVRKNIEAIVSRRGFPVAYPDLSGGEAGLVNVMIALAIGEVVTLEQWVNIRVFDEVFGGLDPENVDTVAAMLTHSNSSISLFVITHEKTFDPPNSTRIILGRDE